MDHPPVHYPGNDAVVRVVHLQSDSLQELTQKPQNERCAAELPSSPDLSFMEAHEENVPTFPLHLNVCNVTVCETTYHWLICVLLELDQADSGDVLQIHVPVGALWGVSVQVG